MKQYIYFLGVAVPLTLVCLPEPVYATSARLYLSPAAANVTTGSNFNVDIRVDTGGDQANALKMGLNYPVDKLELTNINCSDTFNIAVKCTGSDGVVRIEGGALPPASGDQLVATANFKVKASTGTTTLSFSGDSAVYRGSTNILSSTQGGSYTIKTADNPPPAPPKDTTKPIISAIKIANITASSAIVSWQTSEPTTSEITYGLNTRYGLTVADDNLVTIHKLVLKSPLLRPSNLYHFRLKSVDQAGNETYSSDQTFTTQATNNSTSNAPNQPQPGIFYRPATHHSPSPLLLGAGITSLLVSGGLLLMSLGQVPKVSPVDKLLVSTLSNRHKRALKRWLSRRS